jgi:hypothetical protein
MVNATSAVFMEGAILPLAAESSCNDASEKFTPKILKRATGRYEEIYGEHQFFPHNYDYQTILQPFCL